MEGEMCAHSLYAFGLIRVINFEDGFFISLILWGSDPSYLFPHKVNGADAQSHSAGRTNT